MDNESRAAFKEVVRVAWQYRVALREYLNKIKLLDYPARLTLTTIIQGLLLELRPELCPVETRRFAELVTGVADRINAEARQEASKLIDPEMKHFRDTRRSIVLDEVYDLHHASQNHKKMFLDKWLKEGMPDDPGKNKQYNYYRSIMNDLTDVPDLIKKDIEIGLTSKAREKEEKDLTDKHLEELRILHDEFNMKTRNNVNNN